MPADAANTVAAAYIAYIHHVFFFVGGTLITLLVSIFDVARRSAVKIAAGCVFGGLGALLAGMALQSWGTVWMLGGAGIAAVVTENIVLGFVKASKEFSENPLATAIQIVKDLIPGLPFGKKS